MTKCAHLSGISRDFFSPIQQPYQDPQPNQAKNLYDHVSNHLLTTSGCRDFYRVFGYTLTFLKYLPFSSERKEFFDKFGSLAGKFNVALSIPKTVADVNFLKQSLRHLTQVRNHPPVHPERRKIIAQAYKNCIYDGMNVTNSIVEDLMFLHDIDLIKLGKSYPAAEGIYYFTCLVPDSIELITKVYELKHYKAATPTTDVERTVLKDKIKLAWLTIAKDLPAITCAVIGIAALFFVSLQVPVVAAVSMGLSILWLTFKLVSTFYEKTIVEKHARLSHV
jgi:hypothetical protein